jgi:hypothetical protein
MLALCALATVFDSGFRHDFLYPFTMYRGRCKPVRAAAKHKAARPSPFHGHSEGGRAATLMVGKMNKLLVSIKPFQARRIYGKPHNRKLC